MGIIQADLKFYKSEVVGDGSTNGGAMSYDEAVTGSKNNIWPNVSAAERDAGVDLYRKIFAVPHSDTDDQLVDPRLWNHSPTPGDDYVYLFAGTKSDTEATLSEARIFGSASLKTDISAGATTIVVTVENAAQTAMFAALDKVVLSNQVSPELTGDTEIITLNSTAPLVSGLDVTLYLDSPGTTNAFLASNTVVASQYYPGTSEASYGTIVVTSIAGTVDDTTYTPELNNTGTRDEDITITFATTTTVNISGSKSGTLATGASISGDITLTNPTNSKQIMKLFNGFFGGTWVALDTVVIPTISNSSPFWLKRVVPAGSSDLTADKNITAYRGESSS